MILKVVITAFYKEEYLEIPIKLNETVIALFFFSFLRSNIILNKLYYY